MTDPVNVYLGGELVIKTSELPREALEQIKSALTFVNEDKAKAEALRQHGWWSLPDAIPYWRIETRRGHGEVLCLPRGFAAYLFTGLQGMGIPFETHVQLSEAEAEPGYYQSFELRDYQLEAVQAMLLYQQGIYKCPAGGGKTVTSLALAAYTNQRTLIVVDKANLMEQWRARAAQFFKLELEEDENGRLVAPIKGDRSVGKIGQDVWEERDLTIALRQTLFSRGWSMDATKWWSTWGMVIFDECHHLAADTTREVASKMTSRYLFGISATPAKSPTKFKVVESTVGPIIHETPRRVLYEQGVLMQPTIELVQTDFTEAFWIDHEVSPQEKCQVPDCPKNGKRHSHRNNYSSVVKKLVEDKKRNDRIAQRILANPTGIHLVNSRQLKHLDLIRKAVEKAGWQGSIHMLRGKENADGMSQEIAEHMEADAREGRGAVLFSTVAEEGMDIPPIDHVHITFPMRDEGGLIQLVGRGERIFPTKTHSRVVDYRDMETSCFASQAAERDRVFYMLEHPWARDDGKVAA
jgi:superfamily II DNA or RNA helicase